MLPKQAIMPTMTNGAGLCGMPGANGSSTRHTAAPTNAPMTMPGPKMESTSAALDCLTGAATRMSATGFSAGFTAPLGCEK